MLKQKIIKNMYNSKIDYNCNNYEILLNKTKDNNNLEN